MFSLNEIESIFCVFHDENRNVNSVIRRKIKVKQFFVVFVCGSSFSEPHKISAIWQKKPKL